MLTVDELLDLALTHAKRFLIGEKGAELVPTWMIQGKDAVLIIGTPFYGDRSKDMIVSAIRQKLKDEQAISYSFMSEAWASTEDTRHMTGLRPSQREDRREVVIMNAFDHKGGKMRIYEIKRNAKAIVADLVLDSEPTTSLSGRMHNLFDEED